jgi:hypothetical protein
VARHITQNSTGPRTPDGKAAIRENAVRHGLTSSIPSSEREPNEQPDVQRIHDAFIDDNQPVGMNEEVLVYQMTEYFLFQRDGSRILGDLFKKADGAGNNNREIALILRYHTTAVRGFSKALNDLRKLQKERKLQEIGFVSQEVEEAPAEAPSEPPIPSADPPVSPAAPPKTTPVAAPSPANTPIRVEPTAARPAAPRNSIPNASGGQPHTPPKAA